MNIPFRMKIAITIFVLIAAYFGISSGLIPGAICGGLVTDRLCGGVVIGGLYGVCAFLIIHMISGLFEEFKTRYPKSDSSSNQTGKDENNNDDLTKVVITFKEKYSKPSLIAGAGPDTFEVYSAKTKLDALTFLESKNIKEGQYYVVVETPEGNWGKDILGVYKE